MACRFPGAPDVPAFWRLLDEGAIAITEGEPGSGVGRVGELFTDSAVQNSACRFGAFIDGIDQFDAAFFRISPVEAQLLDPQQRLMLEVSWQALEDAGIDPDGLKGSRTGVYAGISNNEYRALVLDGNDTAEPATSLYSVAGTSFNTAIGRVAFALGLRGPAMAVDTACSSSLAAVHQAVSGLQRGEADLALAGGVHAILSGRLFELRGNAGMLAPDGRCKTFDAAADGYVRGEGCGILVLKRLSDAEADGDRIWGVVRGTALNQDGASQGLTVPNGEAQQQVIADALAWAGVAPADVDYVETHGTGTPVGDPIEAEATGMAYRAGRDRPLLIGSVKTNVGHLESAAGAASLIKVMLAMKRGVIPSHLNFRDPNPEIPWDRLPLQVTAEPTEWPRHGDRRPLAGVSGFGWSGTNAHVVVEGYGAPDAAVEGNDPQRWMRGPSRPVAIDAPAGMGDPAAASKTRSARLLPLSAKTGEALRDLATRYVGWLEERFEDPSDGEEADQLLADAAWTAGVGRSHLARRAGVVFSDGDSLKAGLTVLAEGDEPPRRAATRVAFAYTGQASQWVGMGRALYDSEPVFRAVLDRCDEVLQAERGISMLAVMFGSGAAAEDLDDPAWTQPCIYAIECALTALWASVGVQPDVVVGHSLGEIAAAHAAGAFSLEDGLRFAAARGELMGGLPEDGAMAAVFATPERVAAAVEELNASTGGSPASVAADNGMHQVISGPAGKVESLLEGFESEKVWVRRLRKSPAYHSALVEPALDDLEVVVDGIETVEPSVAYVSSMTGRVLEAGEVLDGRYWRRQARAPVAFRTCVETLAATGVDTVIEIGPDTVLGPTVATAWPQQPGTAEPAITSSMRKPSTGKPDPADGSGFLDAAAAAYSAGVDLSFEGLFSTESRRRVPLPGYPFQHQRHWVEPPRRRRQTAGHPLLGTRHDSPRGETLYTTEMFRSDPAWLDDHRVYGRVITPGALYGSMAAAACEPPGDSRSLIVEDLQLHSPMIFEEDDPEDAAEAAGRSVQFVLDPADGAAPRRFEAFSRSDGEDGWTLHAQGQVSSGTSPSPSTEPLELEQLGADLTAVDIAEFYRARADAGVDLGESFRTLHSLSVGDGEALGEVTLPDGVDGGGAVMHPLLLDGCFQVMAAARRTTGAEDGSPYLPFGWERLWLDGPLPDRLLCHARLREPGGETDGEPAGPREVIAADLRFYTIDGTSLGGLDSYTVKRATRAALLSASEGLDDLLYEVVWRDRPLPDGVVPADFLPNPAAVAARSSPFEAYLEAAAVDTAGRASLLTDLERLSWRYALQALERLGWQRTGGTEIEPDSLRQQLGVLPEHGRVFRRLFELLARAGVVEAAGDTFVVKSGSIDSLSPEMPRDPEEFAAEMAGRYEHGSTEIGLFRRSADALAEVLTGDADPLTLLFSSGEPTAADLYLKAPVARAANQMLADAVAALLEQLPEDRRLRVVEIGAGTGSATAAVLPELPEGRFDYIYTDISAGFFAEAEGRFGGREACITYRVLDIEKDPAAQGFDYHSYDLLIASNVLHATRYLSETLEHCRNLLAPSGHLVALENLRGQGWLDLTFGQLDGWWRFADSCRPHHALAGPAVWRQALADAGFDGAEVLGADESDPAQEPDRGVILAQGPAKVTERPGIWVLAADQTGMAGELAARLASRNQTVVLATDETAPEHAAPPPDGVSLDVINMEQRSDWLALFESLPPEVPLNGVGHFTALDNRGAQAATEELASDVKRATATALALLQGLADADLAVTKGVWFVTRGGQVLEHERVDGVAGSALWGFGKVAAREATHLQPRMIDLDPVENVPLPDLSEEFLYPDPETHIAYRTGHRQTARLVRTSAGTERLSLPEPAGEAAWLLEPDPQGALEGLRVDATPDRPLAAGEVRVAVLATGLNFWDMFRSLGVIDEGLLGGEFCGRVLEVGPDVTTVQEGDRVVGLAFGTFSSEAVTCEEMVAPAPAGLPAAALATMPTAFVSAALSFDCSGLDAGEKVLIHAGAGGVGLAAIQLAQAAGAEVFATASAPKQAYLRSLGVRNVYDSRSTKFGEQILEATGGIGVDVVLNSLTGPGFIPASLSCLAQGGRFVELARMDILSHDEMSEARPDVGYWILELDVLKEHDPDQPGEALRRVMQQLATGELKPLVHTRWSLAEAGPAMKYMRAARHIGKIVFAASPLETGRLRSDRTYLVTGGLGGIGCTMAEWLADRGAGAIVLNGRRDPDPEAAAVIDGLRERGATVSVELADMTDAAAVDAMLTRIAGTLPPLGGVIHSVGVLSDASIPNQSWERFEQVLWPKVLGAWQLHRATVDLDLDLFVLFSSVAGVMGNPGQSNHAAANAFLDVLAAHRRSRGLAGQSIAWGAWSGLGEAEEHRERIAGQLEAAGTGWITPLQGLRAFDRLVRQDPAAPMVAAVDWQVVSEGDQHRSPFVEDLLAVAGSSGAQQETQADLLSELGQSPPAGHEQILVEFLRRELQAVMRLPNLPSSSAEFADLGMDSLMAVEFRNRVNRGFAGAYSAGNTVVFDYPSVQSLAAHLASELAELGTIEHADTGADGRFAIQAPTDPGPAETGRTERPAQPERPERAEQADGSDPVPAAATVQDSPAAAVVPPSVTGNQGIAIVGMACRFPGAPDLDSFWHLLEAGENAVTDGRRDPGPWNGAAGDPDNPDPGSRVGAFVEGIDQFDAGFFRIRPIEARMMDPQQRMLLETTWQALEDGGIDPSSLKGSRTGVYAGIGGSSEYRRVIAAAGRGDSYFGTTSSVAVGRIAFTLGLAGPAVPFDLACASSLVAIHHAVTALQQDEVDMALAGGANAVLSPSIAKFLEETGMLSASGQCRAFDVAADGYVRGEGCGMIVLKRLADAVAAGDRIWGVVRGTAVNQNATGLGLTQPNGPAQMQAMEQALERAGVMPAEVDYLEAHGPGSPFGDAVEMNAAASVYGRGRDPEEPLLVGSVKTNIGHLECASAVAGVIKTVLAMNRGRIPRHLHLTEPSTQIDWERLPVRVTTEATDWPESGTRPRLAAVSSFAISGANAHLVLEGFDTGPGAGTAGVSQPVPGTRLLPLSARSDEALHELAGRYLSWLDQRSAEPAPASLSPEELLADMAWTASVGRTHFSCRAAVLFSDVESLREGLQAVAAGQPQKAQEHEAGSVQAVAADYEAGSVQAVAADYEAGGDVAFHELFEGEARSRISLPGYPFERRRHWVEPIVPRI